MKHFLTLCLMFIIAFKAKSQNVSINNDGSLPDANAILDVKSTTKGVLLPRMTETERGNMSLKGSVPLGLIVFQTDGDRGFYYNASSFRGISSWTKISDTSANYLQYAAPDHLYTSPFYKVGIGTAAPMMPLHVSRASDTALLLLENQAALAANVNAGQYFKIGNRYTGAIKTIGTSAAYARLGIFSYASTNQNSLKEQMSILDNGRVGIGTVNPLMPLHVSKEADTATLLLENQATLGNGSNVGMYFKNGTSYTGAIKTIGTSSTTSRLGVFTFASSGTNTLKEGISLLNNGNAGIGITAPTEKLQVDGGNVKIGGAAWTSAANDRLLKFGDGSLVTIGEVGGDDMMQLEAFHFNFIGSGGGNAFVGINNPNPIYTMDVTGQIHTTSNIIIDNTIKIAGGSPGDGKVLTSDATGNASWKSPAYANAERFLMRTSTNLGVVSYGIGYNLGSTTINTNTGEVTISKTGLYHLESKFIALAASDYVQNGANPRTANLFLAVNNNQYYYFASGKPFSSTQIFLPPGSFVTNAVAEFSNSMDIQLSAGNVLKVSGEVPNGSARFSGTFSGYLISE